MQDAMTDPDYSNEMYGMYWHHTNLPESIIDDDWAIGELVLLATYLHTQAGVLRGPIRDTPTMLKQSFIECVVQVPCFISTSTVCIYYIYINIYALPAL